MTTTEKYLAVLLEAKICLCVEMIMFKHPDLYFSFGGEYKIFWAIMKEEAVNNGGDLDSEDGYWWREGRIKPRLKTINSAIKRIQNSKT